MDVDEITEKIVHAAYKTHTGLGPGLLESVYETVMVYELSKIGHDVE
jgi:GxxExxY protein